jgi:hypothetical protein
LFSRVATPLNKLTHNEVKWCWEEAQETAFQELKRLLTTALVMALPDLSKKFYFDSDWSQTGIGIGIVSNPSCMAVTCLAKRKQSTAVLSTNS